MHTELLIYKNVISAVVQYEVCAPYICQPHDLKLQHGSSSLVGIEEPFRLGGLHLFLYPSSLHLSLPIASTLVTGLKL